jgi:ketosteroid isomerase-like protein
MAITHTPTDVGEEFVAALAAQDFERLEGCFAPDVDFHAVVPGTGSYRDAADAAGTAEQYRTWFGGANSFALLESSVTHVVDKLRINYRLAKLDDGEWKVAEQTAYARLGEQGIQKLDLACAGWQTVPADPRSS